MALNLAPQPEPFNTLAQTGTSQPRVQEIQLVSIEIGERKRVAGDVTQLKKSIKEIGLLNPITVIAQGHSYRLAAGLRRLTAHRELGLKAIRCTILRVDELQAELIEIDENIKRKNLSYFEECVQLQRRKEIYESIHPHTKHGTNRHAKTRQDGDSSPRFSLNTAEQTGTSERSVQRKVAIAKVLAPLNSEIIGSPIEHKQSDLMTLAKIAKTQGREAAQLALQAIKQGKPLPRPKVKTTPLHHHSDEIEWYTPHDMIEAARKVLEQIELDPASSVIANETVGAKQLYSIADNGLQQQWTNKVWLCPPFAKHLTSQFIQKLDQEIRAGRVQEAIVLANNTTESMWFQLIGQHAKAFCFPKGQVKFWQPNKGKAKAYPPPGQVIIYIGQQKEIFIQQFNIFGLIIINNGK